MKAEPEIEIGPSVEALREALALAAADEAEPMVAASEVSDERDDALRDFAFALETICARIPPDETHLSGHESTAYQALLKWPEYVRSQHVRRLMG